MEDTWKIEGIACDWIGHRVFVVESSQSKGRFIRSISLKHIFGLRLKETSNLENYFKKSNDWVHILSREENYNPAAIIRSFQFSSYHKYAPSVFYQIQFLNKFLIDLAKEIDPTLNTHSWPRT